jgi:hypothetical protein
MMIVMRMALILALFVVAEMPTPAASQSTAALKARCTQLIAYYDRYGVGRSTNSDGRRNHTRIAAEFDCKQGLYAKGIAEMEALLRRKEFTPPAAGPDVPEDDN